LRKEARNQLFLSKGPARPNSEKRATPKRVGPMVLGKFLKVNEFSFVINTHSDLPAGLAVLRHPAQAPAAMDNAPIRKLWAKNRDWKPPGMAEERKENSSTR
jgi:hypothetical protein